MVWFAPVLVSSSRRLPRWALPLAAVASWGLVAWGFLGTSQLVPRATEPLPPRPRWGPCYNLGNGGPVVATNDVVEAPSGNRTFPCARIWDLTSREELAVLVGHTAPVLSTTLSPDGNSIATAAGDGTARVWDRATGREQLQLADPPTKHFLFVHFAPDGRSLVTACTGVSQLMFFHRGPPVLGGTRAGTPKLTFHRWRLPDGTKKATLALNGSNIMSPLGVYFTGERAIAVVQSGSSINFYDLDSGFLERSFTDPGMALPHPTAAISRDGSRVAVAHADGTLSVWAVAAGVRQSFTALPGRAAGLVFSPDGRYLAFHYSNETNLGLLSQRIDPRLGYWVPHQFRRAGGMGVLDLASGQCWDGLPDNGRPFFTSDGTTLLLGLQKEVQFWDLPPRRVLFSPIAWALLGAALVLNGLWWRRVRKVKLVVASAGVTRAQSGP